MGWKLTGRASGVDVETDSGQFAIRNSARPVQGDHHTFTLQSGLITTIAARTASAGHLAAFRWISATKLCLIHRIGVKWRTVAGFTAAQEIGMSLSKVSTYSASHSSGTAFAFTSPSGKKRSSFTTLSGTDMDFRIGTTAALTAGTQTFDAQPFAFDVFAELAAAATVPKGRMDIDYGAQAHFGGEIQLLQNEGIVLANEILMGAGGTARVTIQIDATVVAAGLSDVNW